MQWILDSLILEGDFNRLMDDLRIDYFSEEFTEDPEVSFLFLIRDIRCP